MGGHDRHLPSSTSTKRPSGTCLLLLMMCVQLIVSTAGSALCDRCETDEVRALRRYYLTLNLPSVYYIGVQSRHCSGFSISILCSRLTSF